MKYERGRGSVNEDFSHSPRSGNGCESVEPMMVLRSVLLLMLCWMLTGFLLSCAPVPPAPPPPPPAPPPPAPTAHALSTAGPASLTVGSYVPDIESFGGEVRSVRVSQEGNRVLFRYELVRTEGTGPVDVVLKLTIRGKEYTAENLSLEGDVGKVSPGPNRVITWHVLRDFPRGLHGDMDWELTAPPKHPRAGSTVVDRMAGVEFKFAYIPPGTFMMGSPSSEPKRDSDETQHRVTLTKGFYMQTTEITQGQWKAVMGGNPSHFKSCGDHCPVESVFWNDCQEFIRKLNQLAGTNRYRLPTEAEWEYAARAGSSARWSFGDNEAQLKEYAWYSENSGGKTQSVARKKPNAWGLYDMHGNVWEWCQDWYGKYPSGSVTDPTGPSSGSYRVLRGGSWDSSAGYCRSAYRFHYTPGGRYSLLGARLLRSYP